MGALARRHLKLVDTAMETPVSDLEAELQVLCSLVADVWDDAAVGDAVRYLARNRRNLQMSDSLCTALARTFRPPNPASCHSS